jgi:glycosyltransferase involved in cell wall biosynthesis
VSAPSLNVLLFWSHDDWDVYHRAYQRIAEELERRDDIRRVVVVFPPAVPPRLPAPPLQIRRLSRRLLLVRELTPVVAPDRPSRRVRGWVNRAARRALPLFLRGLGFSRDDTLLWLFPPHPYLEELLALIPRRFAIGQVQDDFSEFDPEHWLYPHAVAQYPRIPALVDLIFVASDHNERKFAGHGTPCERIELGVGREFLGTPSAPCWQDEGRAPRLGYSGWIMPRTDLDLLARVATRRPDWSLVLVGPQYRDTLDRSGLRKQANVSYLGEVPYQELPGLMRSFDVCLIPHRDLPYTRSMSPLKLYQYLASGRPIVATDVAGLEPAREHLEIATTEDAFIEAIDRVLSTDTVERSRVRLAAAARATWDARVDEMLAHVRRHLR